MTIIAINNRVINHKVTPAVSTGLNCLMFLLVPGGDVHTPLALQTYPESHPHFWQFCINSPVRLLYGPEELQ